jgi:O-acetylhomoserine (thiol)-lyase
MTGAGAVDTVLAPASAAIHAGSRRRLGLTSPVVTPIFQTAAYELSSTAQAAGVFDLTLEGHAYTRLNNPTCEVLEERVAQVEGGVAGLSVSSGQAAIALAVLNLCQAGDNLVSSEELYGGTWNLLATTMRRMGVEARFVSGVDPQAFRDATDERTRCWFGEMLPNPSLRVFPVAEVAELGDELGVPLIVDNTVLPGLCRPIDFGASVVVHSTTKYLGGHGSTLGGTIVDAGRFPWRRHAHRHPLMTEPDEAHGGIDWLETCDALGATPMGRSPYLLKARETLLRDLGACLSPFNAFLLLQGVETLSVRMRAHCENAARVATFLQASPQVSSVRHPSLETGAEAARVARYLPHGGGALVQLELEGGRDAGCHFIEALRLITHATNIGDVRTYATHPASTTHQTLPPAAQLAAGVTPGAVRLAVGLEDADDIIGDIEQALRAIA